MSSTYRATLQHGTMIEKKGRGSISAFMGVMQS